MKKNLFLSVTLAAIVDSSCVFASSSLSKHEDKNKNTTLFIHFENQEAKEIYKHLEYAQKLNGYIVSEAGMNKNYLSSPSITCNKTDPSVLDRKPDDDSPDLYDCHLNITARGLIENP
ncbi:hypothetical protein B488_05860 [Liberibacter crescens BT-1]|uniref:Lipoprotein n=1 Tax=Liberibacter crescens (strain BT-1) TaxID=1215343 RepID=L0EVA6_LIBCB|nr:hypothetical protein [Liberibacter crescens]AGA64578.1 hypothetical protein B488_05860 [Liberibacter crescens BT-1]AMC12712.1 hypothetical protein RL73_03050 [Liberibacter crescens]